MSSSPSSVHAVTRKLKLELLKDSLSPRASCTVAAYRQHSLWKIYRKVHQSIRNSQGDVEEAPQVERRPGLGIISGLNLLRCGDGHLPDGPDVHPVRRWKPGFSLTVYCRSIQRCHATELRQKTMPCAPRKWNGINRIEFSIKFAAVHFGVNLYAVVVESSECCGRILVFLGKRVTIDGSGSFGPRRHAWRCRDSLSRCSAHCPTYPFTGDLFMTLILGIKFDGFGYSQSRFCELSFPQLHGTGLATCNPVGM